MSAFDQGPLARYNSLTDRHLMIYFSNDRMRRHLIKNGLITRGGEVVSDAVYRVRIARREHRRRVRDLIAQAIIHKALEMERSRQIDIRKKIEEISKIELVRRVRSDCNRLGDEECLSYFNEGNMDAKVPSTTPKSKIRRSHSNEFDETRLPVTPDQESRQRLRRILPNEEIETKHLSQLDSLTLGEYARILEKQNRFRIDKLPYLGMGTEFKRQNLRPPRPRKDSKLRKSKNSKKAVKEEESSDGNVVQSARLSQSKVQGHTTVSILFHAPANNRNFDVMVIQQPSGGNTLILYKESITNNTVFQVVSHRHKGFPFSLTFYIDNVKDSRISSCCEYKHKVGKRIGGPSGHFSLFSVDGDDPCFRCLAERDLANEKKGKKSKDTKSNDQTSSRHETISVRSASEEKYKSDEDFESDSDASKASSNDEEEEEEEAEAESAEEKAYSRSSLSSADNKSKTKAIISVNIHDKPNVDRTKTPEIEVNTGDQSDDDVIVTNSNNNAVEVDHQMPDDTNINSGRTSVWTGRSDQQDVLTPKHEANMPIINDRTKVDLGKDKEGSNEHDKVVSPKSSSSNSSSSSSSSPSSSSSSNNSVVISPDQINKNKIVSNSEYDPDKDEEEKVNKGTEEIEYDSDEVVANGDVAFKTKPNMFLNNLVEDNFESESSSSGESVRPLENNTLHRIEKVGKDDVDIRPVEPPAKDTTKEIDTTSKVPIIVGVSSKGHEDHIVEPNFANEGPRNDSIEHTMQKPFDETVTMETHLDSPMLRGVGVRKISSGSSSGSTDYGSEPNEIEGRHDIQEGVEKSQFNQQNSSDILPDSILKTQPYNYSIPDSIDDGSKTENVLNGSLESDNIQNTSIVDNRSNDVLENGLKPSETLDTPRQRHEISESDSGDYMSGSGESSSMLSTDRTPRPSISAPTMIASDREGLQIEIPNVDEDEEVSPENDDRRIEEPRQEIQSPNIPLNASNVPNGGHITPNTELHDNSTVDVRESVSSSLSESDSESVPPIKVEHQAEEETTVDVDREGTKDSSVEGCDVFFSNDDITFKKAKEMFEGLSDKRITSLTIKNCELPSYIFNFIANKLEAQRDIKRIELSGCEVEISLLKLLAKTLYHWPNLNTLILSNNVFVDYSLFDLTNVLGTVYGSNNVGDRLTLELFDVANCSLQENDFGQIIKMIADNTCVENIILDRNDINRKMWKDLREALERNSNTKSVSLKNCITDYELLDEIKNGSAPSIRDRLIID